MPLNKCSICRKPNQGKLASGYWSWVWPTQLRMAFKVFYCSTDAHTELAAMWLKWSEISAEGDDYGCLSCGCVLEPQDCHVTWLDLYMPGKEPEKLDLIHCDPCATMLRGRIGQLGIRLADRSEVARGVSPALETAWDTLIPHRI